MISGAAAVGPHSLGCCAASHCQSSSHVLREMCASAQVPGSYSDFCFSGSLRTRAFPILHPGFAQALWKKACWCRICAVVLSGQEETSKVAFSAMGTGLAADSEAFWIVNQHSGHLWLWLKELFSSPSWHVYFLPAMSLVRKEPQCSVGAISSTLQSFT